MRQPYAIIIEDDLQLSHIYTAILQRAGYETATDMNGNQYQLLLYKHADLIILDLHIPYADSGEVFNSIRAQCPETVITIVTADFVKAKTFEGRADYVLLKPVSVARLTKIAESIKETL